MKKASIIGLLLCSFLLVGCSKTKKTSEASKASNIEKSSSQKSEEIQPPSKSEVASTETSTSSDSKAPQQAAPQNTGDLDIDAIEKGDFTSLIGVWQNGKGDTFTINSNQTLVTFVDGQTSQPLKLKTGVNTSKGPRIDAYVEGGTGFAVALFKIGFQNPDGDQSDISRPRLIGTQNAGNYPAELYFYRK